MTKKHYLVDGYNLLFSLYEGENLQHEREELISMLAPFAKKAQITIVFDSIHSEDFYDRGHIKDIEIIYTAHKKSADDEIVDWVESDFHPELITVVTSDKGIARRVINCGAHHVDCSKFVRWLVKNKQSHKGLDKPLFSKKELERWEKIFEARLKTN